ncbi:MAG: gliding motility-associated C-terminal domain-containing protein [Cryomorphaceae bacterium]
MVLSVAVETAAQNNVYVSDASGSNGSTCGTIGSPCLSIQYAIDSIALDGDSIIIDTGEYALASSVSSFTPVVKLPQGKSLSFRGSTDGQGTRINGDATRRGFLYYYSGTGCSSGSANDGVADSLLFTFEDLIIEDCKITETCGTTSYAYGGGMRIDCDTGSELRVFITDCIFRDNQAFDSPGTFAGGRSSSGGAIFIYGRRHGNANAGTFAEAHISGCDFSGNFANQNWNGGHGGAILLRDLDTASVVQSSFCDNYVYSQSADNGDLQHDRNAGGAICFYDMYNTNPGHGYLVDQCTFINNSATTNSGVNFTFNSEGGAIFLTKGDVLNAQNTATVHISSSSFYNNYIETGIEHIDKNGGSIDTTSVGFNAYYDEFEVGLGDDTALCEGDTMTLNAQMPGGIYLWHDGSTGPTFTVVDSGSYSVTVTVGSCTVADTIEIAVQPYPLVDLGNDTVLCPYDSVELDAFIQDATYTWSTGDSTASIFYIDSGEVWVEVSINGCGATDTIVIDTVNLHQNVLPNDTILCPNASMTLNAFINGALYAWQDGSSSFTYGVNQPGTYSVSVFKEGCSVSDTVEVEYVVQINDIIGNDQIACDQDSIELLVTQSGLESILWSNGSTDSVIYATSPGMYGVTINDRGCLFEDSILASFKPLPEVELGPDTSACQGKVIWLDAYYAGCTYMWNTNYTSPYYPVAKSGTYKVTVTLNGCSVTDQIDIEIHPTPNLEVDRQVDFCLGDSAEITARGPQNGNYLWSNGTVGKSITVYSSGTYSVTVTQQGCTRTDSTQVDVHPIPQVELGENQTQCEGTVHVLKPGLTGVEYLWQDGSTDSVFTVSEKGTYWVVVSAFGCGTSDTFRYYTRPGPTLRAINDTTICFGDTFSFWQKDTNTLYFWNDRRNGLKQLVDGEGVYTVEASNDCGRLRDTARIDIRECDCRMYIPNAFSPYADGINDVFEIGHSCNISKFSITLFDRWGGVVFYSQDPDFQWDGKVAGTRVQVGNYSYRIEYNAFVGLHAKKARPFVRSGSVTVLR